MNKPTASQKAACHPLAVNSAKILRVTALKESDDRITALRKSKKSVKLAAAYHLYVAESGEDHVLSFKSWLVSHGGAAIKDSTTKQPEAPAISPATEQFLEEVAGTNLNSEIIANAVTALEAPKAEPSKAKASKAAKTAKAAKPVKTEKPVVELLPFEKRVELRRVHLTAYNEMRRLQRSGENAERLSELQAWLKENGGAYNSQQLSDPALRAALKAAAK